MNMDFIFEFFSIHFSKIKAADLTDNSSVVLLFVMLYTLSACFWISFVSIYDNLLFDTFF